MIKARICILFSLSISLFGVYFVYEMFNGQSSISVAAPPSLTTTRAQRVAQRINETFIPRRLHQTYLDTNIPNNYHEHIKSWIENHPDWEYYFWTDRDGERLIRERYPQYAAMFASYQHPLMKSDAIRYFVLHQFGGVYADMDVRSLKPIEPFLRANTCIVVPEPYVQTKLPFNRPMTITNAFMASTSNHPFLTYLIDRLVAANRPFKSSVAVLEGTGPFLLNSTFVEYNRKYPSCKNGTYCHVYNADYKYLMPRFDEPNLKYYHSHKCGVKSQRAKLGLYELQACEELKRTNFRNLVPAEAYTDHLWLHIGWLPKKGLKTRPIKEIVPGVLQYSMFFHG